MISIRNTSLRSLARVTARSAVLAATLTIFVGCADDPQQRVMVQQPIPNNGLLLAQTTQTVQPAQLPAANAEDQQPAPVPAFASNGAYHTRPTYYFPIVGMGVGH